MGKTALQVLRCPQCDGEVDLDKNQEYGFCKYCGTKVQNSNFKIVKGTVKIDKKSEMDNYYILARRAYSNEDYDSAVRFYDMILLIDPDSYEALFYITLCGIKKCYINEISSHIKKLTNCTKTVFLVIRNKLPESEQEKEIYKYGNLANDAITLLTNKYVNYYESINPDAKRNLNGAFVEIVLASAKYLDFLTDFLLSLFPESRFINENAGTLYSNANYWESLCLPKLASKNVVIQSIHNRTQEIRKFIPDYIGPNTSTGGCYVATCVYGSYDCPQVWTLRRYRDYDLAKTWYGKLFIKTYYAISPTIVKLFGNTEWFKKMWKGKLDKIVSNLQKKGYKNTPYDDINW